LIIRGGPHLELVLDGRALDRELPRECLDWMLVVNQRHLETVIHEYCLHYNDERPRRSRNLRPPGSHSDPILMAGGPIARSTRLGGLLSDYRQLPVAAWRHS
jgi:hypothetical protein